MQQEGEPLAYEEIVELYDGKPLTELVESKEVSEVQRL